MPRMPWTLRITNTVPFVNRGAYEREVTNIIGMFPVNVEDPPCHAEHVGSYRVAFGNTLEFMHLFKCTSLDEWQNLPLEICRTAEELLYGENLVTESRYEWLRKLRTP